MNKNLSILIPDGESSVIIKVLRCLSDYNNIKIHIVSSEFNIPISYSSLVSSFYYNIELRDPEKWIEAINLLIEKYNIDVIMPTYTSGIRRLIEYRNKLLNPEKTLLPASVEIFDLANSKKDLAKHMELHGIPYPKSWTLGKSDYLNNELNSLNYPILIKPSADIGQGIGINKFDTSNELKDFLLSNQPNNEVFLQEYLEGVDLGFNALCKNGDVLAFTIQLGTLFHDQAYKPQIGLKMIKEEKVLESMRKLLKSLNWSGVAHIDLLYDIKTKQFKVLEINPRFWQTLQASSFADVNFPWLYCQAVMRIDFASPEYKEIEYLTIHGIVKKVKENPLFLLRLRYIWTHTPTRYLLKDPAPYLILLYKNIKGFFVNHFKRN